VADIQVAPAQLWIVQRPSHQYGITHVALVDWIPSWSHPYGDPRLSRVIELSDSSGLTVRPFDENDGWVFVACINDQQGVRQRLEEVLDANAAYDIVFNNCEHMVWYVATGVRKSPQLRSVAFAVIGVIALVACIKSANTQVA
jgi:hypothetical protein